MTMRWIPRYALRTEHMESSHIREILKVTQQPGIISFAGGLPAPEVFPVEKIQEAANRVLEEHGAQALQYSTTEGYPPLREYLVEKLTAYGVTASVDNVMITHGSQQGLDLIGKVFLDRGNCVLVEDPTYLGAIQAWRPYEPRFVTVPADDDGMLVDEVEEILITRRPKLIYALPNFQNPGGTTMPEDRREKLVELAHHFETPIIEDDPYGELRYSGEHLTPIIVLDARKLAACGGSMESNLHQGDVIYMGTFSKTFTPGFRLGWVVAPPEVLRKLVTAKQGTDLHTNTFGQMVAYEVVKDGFLKEHVRMIRRIYGERRDAMLAAMEEHFPEGVSWTKPDGGLFLWVRCPEGTNTEELLKDAIKESVAFVPGVAFHANGGGENTMRLNFSNAEPERIREGIERLGRALRRHLEASSPSAARA